MAGLSETQYRKKGINLFLETLLKKILPDYYTEAVVGDLVEIYKARSEDNRLSAKIWLTIQILTSLLSLLKKNMYGSVAMFKNYFLMAFRNLRKHRVYTLINIIGLALGLLIHEHVAAYHDRNMNLRLMGY